MSVRMRCEGGVQEFRKNQRGRRERWCWPIVVAKGEKTTADRTGSSDPMGVGTARHLRFHSIEVWRVGTWGDRGQGPWNESPTRCPVAAKKRIKVPR